MHGTLPALSNWYSCAPNPLTPLLPPPQPSLIGFSSCKAIFLHRMQNELQAMQNDLLPMQNEVHPMQNKLFPKQNLASQVDFRRS